MEYIEYRTKDNDRWDLIAYEMYGNAYDYQRILEANPEFRDITVFPAGIVLKIPVIEETDLLEEVNPPWITD